MHGPEARFDVAETFPKGQLSKSHAQELIHTRKALDLVIASVALNAFLKFVGGKEFHHLRENGFAGVHDSLLWWERQNNTRVDSNRLKPFPLLTY
jgi:hypothetical protein